MRAAAPAAAAPALAVPPRAARPYPAHLIEFTTLPDGTPLTIRPIRRSDLRLEAAFLSALSPATRYQRLLSARRLLPGELRRLTHIDYQREMALVAVATVDGIEQAIGVARYVRDELDPRSCEFAIVVADRWQGRGVGEKLLRSLLRVAVDEGFLVVTGMTLSSNGAMLALARKLGFAARREPGNATMTDLRRDVRTAQVDSAPASIGAVAHADLWFGPC